MQTIDTTSLQDWMHIKGISARRLSLEAGLNETAVRDILNGKSQITRPQTILRISKVLDVPPSLILSMSYVNRLLEKEPESAHILFSDLGLDFESFSTVDDYGNRKFVNAGDAQTFKEITSDKNLMQIERRVNFGGADLSGAHLKGARLPYADFLEANLKNTDLSSADLSHASFMKADLTGTNLQNSDLSGALFNDTIMEGTLLRGANLTGAKMDGCDLTKVIWG